jgi:hypothetical protein
MLMIGFKYTAFKETLSNPDFDKVSVSISAFNSDYGMMYSYKRGLKKCFFTYPRSTKAFGKFFGK